MVVQIVYRLLAMSAAWAVLVPVTAASEPRVPSDPSSEAFQPAGGRTTHWAFVPPHPTPLPDVSDPTWVRNGVDAFVLRRLDADGIAPSPTANKVTLIRRVSLDLTGLPPTAEELDDFLADDAPGAYARLVDRLLAADRFGEQMASEWLDGARYADTYGYQDDGAREMWRWRDWVINAFNDNMPFDQFTIEQLAGDLLPQPTRDQLIATAFNRNHRANAEGGAIPEEFRVEAVVDRVDTTATVWLGLTMVCARCHDHKYDPISQREFYELFAFFNNIDEDGRARKSGNTPPLMAAPTSAQLSRLPQLNDQLATARHALDQLEPEIVAAQTAWERSVDPGDVIGDLIVNRELEVHFPLNGNLTEAVDSTRAGTWQDGVPSYCPGTIDAAAAFDGSRYVSAGDIGGFSSDDEATLAAWIMPTAANGSIISKMDKQDDPRAEGYNLLLRDGHVRLHFVSQWVDDSLRLETVTQVPLHQWTHVVVTYDASHVADGVRIYFDGIRQPLRVEFDGLFQGFSNDGPLRLGMDGGHPQFQGAIDDVRIHEDVLTLPEIELLATPDALPDLLATPVAHRTRTQAGKLRAYFLKFQAPAKIAEARARVDRLQDELKRHVAGFPTLMVMRERAERRPTHVLTRGQYDAPAIEVEPAVPAIFPALPPGAPTDRLGLARWLVDPRHPLTARVLANRLWQMSFGTGIVKTSEDFGTQGDPPSHPGLLDWLAIEIVRSGWDVKSARRLIVTSAAYRQDSRVNAQLLAVDPDNRLLARGPRFRLPAETIRDQALLVSGLLVQQLGGPSVRPYQPTGLWEELSNDKYEPDQGDGRYRRSLYTFWKRTVHHPTMAVFDAPSREFCTVRETRTNTPLQALALLNEPGFVEAAQALANRILREAEPSEDARLSKAHRLVTGRQPQSAELRILKRNLRDHVNYFQKHESLAQQLGASDDATVRQLAEPPERAAYTAVMNMLLNLDETVTQH